MPWPLRSGISSVIFMGVPPTRIRAYLAAALLLIAAPVVPQNSSSSFGPAELQRLLQGFVSAQYGRSFRHLGDERDFDHGHVLYAAGSDRPAAILYHTQELAHEAQPGFGYLDPAGRNWLQWIDSGKIVNAAAFERHDYPSTASWDWFKLRRLPALTERHTIVEEMLDPQRIGFEPSQGRQWTFTRTDCARHASSDSRISVRLPSGEDVCLALEVL